MGDVATQSRRAALDAWFANTHRGWDAAMAAALAAQEGGNVLATVLALIDDLTPAQTRAMLADAQVVHATLYNLRHQNKGGMNTRTAEKLLDVLDYKLVIVAKHPQPKETTNG